MFFDANDLLSSRIICSSGFGFTRKFARAELIWKRFFFHYHNMGFVMFVCECSNQFYLKTIIVITFHTYYFWIEKRGNEMLNQYMNLLFKRQQKYINCEYFKWSFSNRIPFVPFGYDPLKSMDVICLSSMYLNIWYRSER